jgi:uncharacterized protein
MFKEIEQETSQWSGGKTTQLAIYPREAEYTQRNFIWRISSAEVEVEESQFTHLPGFQRFIMILEGEMFLQHEGQHQVLLKTFEQDRFNGSWKTRSRGKAKDFNLMLAQGYEGELRAVHIQNEVLHLTLDSGIWQVFYCFKGTITATIREEETFVLEKGNVLILNSEDLCKNRKIRFANQGERPAVLIQASIFHG